jgi:hypothetical protein
LSLCEALCLVSGDWRQILAFDGDYDIIILHHRREPSEPESSLAGGRKIFV